MSDYINVIPDYDLLALYFAGEASVAQIQAIEKWVDENPANKKSFDRVHFLWTKSAHEELKKQVNVTDAWTKMRFRMNPVAKPVPEISAQKSIYKRTSYRFLQLAAVIAFGLVIGSLVNYLTASPEYVSKEALLAAIDVKLPDNSEIKLNKDSKISYPENFKGKERKVKLEGEAFFDVEADKEKPFIIETQFAQIKVLGTSFNVQAFDTSDIVEVTVISGIVELSGQEEGSEKIVLKKGEKGRIEKSTGIPIKEQKVDENELFWATRTIVFKDTELHVATEILSNAYGVEIEVGNEQIKYCKFNATFTDARIDEIIEVIRLTLDLTVEQSNNNYKLNGTKCK